MSEPENQTVAAQIAETLGETSQQPRQQISAIVEQCGVEFAQSLLQETMAVEAGGGMMLPDNSRRRTAGGVFFYLARGKLPRETAKRIFPNYFKPKPVPKALEPTLPALEWADRIDLLKTLLDKQGVLSTVKVTLIGRPGKIDSSRKDLVITAMSHTAKAPTLPKGVPTPPTKPTLYTVYIAAKQWRKIESAIANPEDALIVEGTCAYDEQIGGIAVYALNVTTKLTEVSKRQQQREIAGTPEPTPAAPAALTQNATTPTVPTVRLPDMPNAPAEVTQKLGELYASASLFRQKIAAIQAKPVGQQSGLEMTQKLLKNVEDEIAVLEKKYAG